MLQLASGFALLAEMGKKGIQARSTDADRSIILGILGNEIGKDRWRNRHPIEHESQDN
jgi:hypothetical protein